MTARKVKSFHLQKAMSAENLLKHKYYTFRKCPSESNILLDENGNEKTNVCTPWSELLYRLTRNGKIEKGAIVHPDGHIAVQTQGFDFSQKDIKGIKCALSGKYRLLMKISLCGSCFTCFRHGDDVDTVVGKTDEEVFVAHRASGFIIVAISHPETPGSTIYEVTKFGRGFKRKMQREKIG